METEITRLIASAAVALVLGYVLYVAAYVKHKTEKLEDYYDFAVREKDYTEKTGEAYREPPADVVLKKEKVDSWYMGYRLAAIVAVLAAAAVGWAAAWIVSQEYGELTQVEDCIVAAAGALLGGLVVDRYVIHPIADGSFFEKVEVPIIENFLKSGIAAIPEKTKAKKLPKLKKARAESPAEVHAAEIKPAEAEKIKEELSKDPPVIVQDEDPLASLTFDEKTKLIEKLRRML